MAKVKRSENSRRHMLMKKMYCLRGNQSKQLFITHLFISRQQQSCTIEASRTGTSYGQNIFTIIKVPSQKKKINYRYVAVCPTYLDRANRETFVRFVPNWAKQLGINRKTVELKDLSFLPAINNTF